MSGTRRLLAIGTARARNGRTHVLVDQRATIASLASRAHPKATLCGRTMDCYAGEANADEYGRDPLDCKRCTLLAESRGWIAL